MGFIVVPNVVKINMKLTPAVSGINTSINLNEFGDYANNTNAVNVIPPKNPVTVGDCGLKFVKFGFVMFY